jgi:hypothetical protein
MQTDVTTPARDEASVKRAAVAACNAELAALAVVQDWRAYDAVLLRYFLLAVERVQREARHV